MFMTSALSTARASYVFEGAAVVERGYPQPDYLTHPSTPVHRSCGHRSRRLRRPKMSRPPNPTPPSSRSRSDERACPSGWGIRLSGRGFGVLRRYKHLSTPIGESGKGAAREGFDTLLDFLGF